jgi:drug/metabolite transporter (DMT)-like permease
MTHNLLAAHWLLAQCTGTSCPAPTDTALPGQVQTQLDSILGWVKWLGLAAAFAGLFTAAGRMTLSHRLGSGGEHMSALGYIAGGLVLIGSASALVGFFV